MDQERRRFQRASCLLPVRLYPKQESRVIETLTKDLSVGGLRCVSQHERQIGMPLSVELMLEPGERPLTLRGHVAWSRPIQESEQYDLGVSFHAFPESTKKRLSTYIDFLSTISAIPAGLTD